jgi:hypothetical protein
MARVEESVVDPLQHPDLRRLGRDLRRQLEDTLDAELDAARAAARRRRSMRDLLLEAEDRGDPICLAAADGTRFRGRITAVGSDHVELTDPAAGRVVVVLEHVMMVELP